MKADKILDDFIERQKELEEEKAQQKQPETLVQGQAKPEAAGKQRDLAVSETVKNKKFEKTDQIQEEAATTTKKEKSSGKAKVPYTNN